MLNVLYIYNVFYTSWSGQTVATCFNLYYTAKQKKKDTKRPSPIDPMIISRALMFLDYPKLINPSLAPGTDLQVTQHNVMEGKESVPQTKYLSIYLCRPIHYGAAQDVFSCNFRLCFLQFKKCYRYLLLQYYTTTLYVRLTTRKPRKIKFLFYSLKLKLNLRHVT